MYRNTLVRVRVRVRFGLGLGLGCTSDAANQTDFIPLRQTCERSTCVNHACHVEDVEMSKTLAQLLLLDFTPTRIRRYSAPCEGSDDMPGQITNIGDNKFLYFV